jgi:hypothetical protein
MDSTAVTTVTTTVTSSTDTPVQLWRLPLDGSAPQAIFSSSDTSFSWMSQGPLAQDDSYVYFGSNGQGQSPAGFYAVPKSGGAATLARSDVYVAGSEALVRINEAFYANDMRIGLARFSLDPRVPPQPIATPYDPTVVTWAGVTDNAASVGYVALGVNGDANTNWIAIAPLPTDSEQLKAIGCSPVVYPTPGNPVAGFFAVSALALDADYVYGILELSPAGGDVQWQVFRVHR